MVDNPDEPVVPVIWAADPKVDGYYRVREASFPMNEAAARYDDLFTATFELGRVAGLESALWESQLIGTTLTNNLGVTGSGFFGFPQGNVLGNPYTKPDVAADVTRPAEGFAMRLLFFSFFNVTPQWRMPLSDHYAGAATLEYADGGTYRPVVGSALDNAPTSFRLSNGLTRCTIRTESGEAELDVAHYDGSQWDAAKDYRFEAVGAYTLKQFTHISVLRNSPEEVVIRLTPESHGEGLTTVDLWLRRGDRWVRGYLRSETARQWKILRDSAEAATTLTGGIRATSNDAAGNRFMLATTASGHDLTNGGVFLGSAGTTFDFGIGTELGGSGATGTNAATGTRGMIEQYFAAQSERMMLAGR
jgi:hypothetical protein